MTPLSHRPEARERQLANLQQGGPPAPAGNQRALRHGGYAAQAEERVGEIFAAIAADVPLRADDGGLPASDAATVRLLADVLSRLDQIGDFLRTNGLFGHKGKLHPAVELESKLRREAADHCDALGLSPRARVRLGLDIERARRSSLDNFIDGTAEEATE